MAVRKKFINSGLLFQGDIIDSFRKGSGLYDTPAGEYEGKSDNWVDKKINFVMFNAPLVEHLAGTNQGCFDVNDIFHVFPVGMWSRAGAPIPEGKADVANGYDNAGRTLEQFNELLYGIGPGGGLQGSLFGTAETGLLPFGEDGIFNKTFFNTQFYDYNFNFPKPSKLGGTTYSMEAEYNYYVKEYEDTIADEKVFESITPYLYSFADEIYNANLEVHADFFFQTKGSNSSTRLFLNDPKRQIFLGGSYGFTNAIGFDVKGMLGIYWPEQNKINGLKYAFDFWSQEDSAQWVAVCETSMTNHAYKGLDDYSPDLVKYDFKGKQISFADYFKSWSHEYNNPSAKDLFGNAEPENNYATFMRTWLKYKYKNI